MQLLNPLSANPTKWSNTPKKLFDSLQDKLIVSVFLSGILINSCSFGKFRVMSIRKHLSMRISFAEPKNYSFKKIFDNFSIIIFQNDSLNLSLSIVHHCSVENICKFLTILSSFFWKLYIVFAKNWYCNPNWGALCFMSCKFELANDHSYIQYLFPDYFVYFSMLWSTRIYYGYWLPDLEIDL